MATSVTNVVDISSLFSTNIPGDFTATTVLVANEDTYITGADIPTVMTATGEIGNIGVVSSDTTTIFATGTAPGTVQGELNSIFQKRGGSGTNPFRTNEFDPTTATFSANDYVAPVKQSVDFTFNATAPLVDGATYSIRIDNVTNQAIPSTNYRLDYVGNAGETGATLITKLQEQFDFITNELGETPRITVTTANNVLTVTAIDWRTTFKFTVSQETNNALTSITSTDQVIAVGTYEQVHTMEVLGNKIRKMTAYPQSSFYENYGDGLNFSDRSCTYDIFTIVYKKSQKSGSPYNGLTTDEQNRIIIACKQTSPGVSGTLFTTLKTFYGI